MLYVALSQLTQAYQELQRQDNIFRRNIEYIEEVINELGKLSGLQGPMRDLRIVMAGLYDDRQRFYQLAQVLSKAIACYSCCEERICEEYDHSSLSYPRSSTGFLDLEELSDWLFLK